MTSRQKKNYFFLYTLLFAALVPVAYSAFAGRTFIKDGDGFVQHYRALVYYSKWLRQIVETLFTEHRLVLPEWEFSLGFGGNILTTLHYYAIGDPLNLLSVFVPERFMMLFYCILILVRSYLAGIAFSCLAIYLGKRNPYGILAGACTYVFSHYILLIGTRHPFFANPMIYFPLVILGVEKIFRREKPYAFIASVFVSVVSNFYFFYMIVLLTVCYVLIRCACAYGWKGRMEALRMILRIGIFSVVGVLLGSFLFLPVMWAFLNDHRMEVEASLPLLYAANYYWKLAFGFIGYLSAGKYSMMGYGVHALFAAVLLLLGFRRKTYGKSIRALFFFASVLVLLPFAAYALNGFAYVSNRWIWAYGLAAAFALCTVWDDFFAPEKRDILLLGVLSAGYFVVVAGLIILHRMGVRQLLPGGYYAVVDSAKAQCPFFAALFLVIVLSARARGHRWKTAAQIVALFLVAAGMMVNANGVFRSSDAAEDYLTLQEAEKRYAGTPDKAVLALDEGEDGFFRYAGDAVVENSSLNAGTHNTNFYWSISNKNVADFLIESEANEHRLYRFSGLDDRTILTALSGTRYYLCDAGEQAKIPYGFRFLKTRGKYDIYVNDYALPLGYTYDSFRTREQTEGLNGAQKEEVMLQEAVLEEAPSGYAQETAVLSGGRVPYSVASMDEEMTAEENAFTLQKKNQSVTLQPEETPGPGENYLCFHGFRYEGSASQINIRIRATTADGTTTVNTLFYSTEDAQWPSTLEEHTVNLGYAGSQLKEIVLEFPAKGKYTFDELYIWHQPLQNYEEQIESRKEDVLENEKIGTDSVSGTIDLETDKILLLTIPYDGGWTAYVDGEKQEIKKANYMFSALLLQAGHHEITLKYRTPLFNAGLALTLLGWILFAGIAVRQRKGRKYHVDSRRMERL